MLKPIFKLVFKLILVILILCFIYHCNKSRQLSNKFRNRDLEMYEYYESFLYQLSNGIQLINSIARSQYFNYTQRSHKVYDEISKCLRNNGTVTIKFGQWLASKKEALPVELCHMLNEMQENNNVHDFHHTKSILTKYGLDKCLDVNQNVLGSGCMGQVYSARIKNKELFYKQLNMQNERNDVDMIAIKILHPGIETSTFDSLMTCHYIIDLLSMIPNIKKKLDMLDFDGFFASIYSQCDLIEEGQNLLRFKSKLDHPRFKVPDLYFASKEILIESFVEGKRFDELPQEHVKEAFMMLTSLRCHMLTGMNFSHCDMHQGNFKYRVQNRVDETGQESEELQMILYDFSMMYEEHDPAILVLAQKAHLLPCLVDPEYIAKHFIALAKNKDTINRQLVYDRLYGVLDGFGLTKLMDNVKSHGLTAVLNSSEKSPYQPDTNALSTLIRTLDDEKVIFDTKFSCCVLTMILCDDLEAEFINAAGLSVGLKETFEYYIALGWFRPENNLILYPNTDPNNGD